jgi:hypothetical protein
MGPRGYFVVSQTAIPAVLFLPGTQGIRFYVRVASFAISLALLMWWRWRREAGKMHSARRGAVSIITRQRWSFILHEFDTRGLPADRAVCPVMAPLFWAPAVVHG